MKAIKHSGNKATISSDLVCCCQLYRAVVSGKVGCGGRVRVHEGKVGSPRGKNGRGNGVEEQERAVVGERLHGSGGYKEGEEGK